MTNETKNITFYKIYVKVREIDPQYLINFPMNLAITSAHYDYQENSGQTPINNA